MRLKPDQFLQFYIKGEVSLCKAYIPINNLQQDSNLDVDGKKIEIPRVEDQTTPPVSLILDARTPNWKNLTELYRNDRFYVALYREKKTTVSSSSIYNYCTKTMTTADCREGKRTYSPICGRYSLWNGTNSYVGNCEWATDCDACGQCGSHCSEWDCWGHQIPDCCYKNVTAIAPEPYANNNSHSYPAPWSSNISDLWQVTTHSCSSKSSYISNLYMNRI